MTLTRKPDSLHDIIAKIRVLRAYTVRTGFRTTKSQNEILARLNADDLATVLLVLEGNENADASK